MSFKLSQSLMDATPNSSKLAEILLQLKDDGISRLVSNHQEEPIPASQQTVYDEDMENDNDEPHTLPASEACNCRKSKCLKLYCQCFAGRAICGQYCRCVECENRTVTSVNRVMAIKNVLERNPNAFESKYKTANPIEQDESAPIAHKNGCRCRKSMCLKKYCECFQGGAHCSGICTCVGCHNREGASPAAPLSTRSNSVVSEFSEKNSRYLDAQISALQEAQTLSILQGLKRSFSEGHEQSYESELASSKPELTRQLSLKSDPGFPSSASKPPLVPLIKRRKLEGPSPTNHGATSLTANIPSTPAQITLTNVLGAQTPLTIRSASPNSLSIAKALSLLSNAGNVHITITEGTPLNDISTRTISCTSTGSKSSHNSIHSASKSIASPDNEAYTNLPEQFLVSSQAETDNSGENSADTSAELTDGDFTHSETEYHPDASKLEEVIASHMMLSPNTSIVIHVE